MSKKVRRRRKAALKDSASNSTQKKQKNMIIGGMIALGVIALFVLLRLSLSDPVAIAGMIDFGSLGRGHDVEASYEDTGLPPAGGVHHPAWQNCGIYYDPIDSANAVHALEHGAVWITYQPNLAEAEVEQIRDYARGEDFLLISPFPDLQSPIVIQSWGLQLELEDADDERIATFIQRNKVGSRTPEPGATCGNGVGTPDET